MVSFQRENKEAQPSPQSIPGRRGTAGCPRDSGKPLCGFKPGFISCF